MTARQYGSLNPDETFVQTVDELARLCQEVVDNYVVESVLRPLQRTIALR